MKNDTQFIESIYEKKTARDKAVKRRTATVLTIAFAVMLIASSKLLVPHNRTPANDVSTDEVSHSNVAGVSTEDESEAEKLVVLTCPPDATVEGVEAYIDTPIASGFAIRGSIDDTRFYDTLQVESSSNVRFAVALEIDGRSTFKYKGKTLDELFYTADMNYKCFRDESYTAYNEYITAFNQWYRGDGYKNMMAELVRRKDTGDAEAEELYGIYLKTPDEELFRNLVWDATLSAEEKAALNAQIAEYEAIFKAYRDESEDYLKNAYDDELKRLVAEGYDLSCSSDVSGRVMLVGALTSEQILYFNNSEDFSYVCTWLGSVPSKDGEATDLSAIISEAEADE